MATLPLNIQRFNDIAIKLFEKLYSSFPECISIDGCAIGAEAILPDASQSDAFDTVVMGDFVVTWLSEEGFIRYESRDLQGNYYGVRLTLRGLTILGYVPSSVSSRKEPIIERIKQYLSSTTGKATGEAAKVIVGELFRLSLVAGHPTR